MRPGCEPSYRASGAPSHSLGAHDFSNECVGLAGGRRHSQEAHRSGPVEPPSSGATPRASTAVSPAEPTTDLPPSIGPKAYSCAAGLDVASLSFSNACASFASRSRMLKWNARTAVTSARRWRFGRQPANPCPRRTARFSKASKSDGRRLCIRRDAASLIDSCATTLLRRRRARPTARGDSAKETRP